MGCVGVPEVMGSNPSWNKFLVREFNHGVAMCGTLAIKCSLGLRIPLTVVPHAQLGGLALKALCRHCHGHSHGLGYVAVAG